VTEEGSNGMIAESAKGYTKFATERVALGLAMTTERTFGDAVAECVLNEKVVKIKETIELLPRVLKLIPNGSKSSNQYTKEYVFGNYLLICIFFHILDFKAGFNSEAVLVRMYAGEKITEEDVARLLKTVGILSKELEVLNEEIKGFNKKVLDYLDTIQKAIDTVGLKEVLHTVEDKIANSETYPNRLLRFLGFSPKK
jgi:ribosomal protein L12E/L44/L45/RPP1/RPP2